MEGLKDNYHRTLHHKLTSGEISPEEYSRKIEKFNRESMRRMIRKNLSSGKLKK